MSINRTRWLDKLRPAGASSGGWTEGPMAPVETTDAATVVQRCSFKHWARWRHNHSNSKLCVAVRMGQANLFRITNCHLCAGAMLSSRFQQLDLCGGDIGFLKGIPENRRECVDKHTHSQYTSVQYSLFTCAERTSRAWLKASTAQELHRHLCAPEKSVCHLVLHASHPLLLSPLQFTTNTSSSSVTLPSTAQEHAAQSVQTRAFSRTASTSRTSPSSHSRQAAASRITLA